MTHAAPIVRDSRDDDLPRIHEIYRHHVLHGTGSFEIEPPTLQEMGRRRGDVLGNGFPYLVAERDGVVTGFDTGPANGLMEALGPGSTPVWGQVMVK